MSRGKPTLQSEWRGGFLFVGNQLILDFLNTLPIQDGKPTELLPDFRALLRWFHAGDLIPARDVATLLDEWGNSERARDTLEAMRKMRETLRKVVIAWERGGSVPRSVIDELNRLMSGHPMLTKLRPNGRGFSAQLWFDSHEPEDLFAPLAHSAADMFANADRRRVRKCAKCVLHFRDISKRGKRRWCSMQLCGNRAKVAVYAARHGDSDQK